MKLKNKSVPETSAKLVGDLHISELKILIDERFKIAFKIYLKQNLKNDLLTRSDITQIFKISFVTVYKWTKKGLLNPIKISNRVYYRKTEIDKMLNNNKN